MSDKEENKMTDQPELAIKFHFMEESVTSPIIDLFPGQSEGMVRGEPGDFVFSYRYGNLANEIYQFQPREDDVWVCTFSKSGTTWTQEMVWLIANDCDTGAAKQTHLTLRSPYLEFECQKPLNEIPSLIREMTSLKSIANRPSPRIIKSHLPFYLLPPKLLDTCKVVYVARNPKDVIVSNYYHFKLFRFHNFQGTLDQFAEYTMQGKVYYAPYFPHVLEAWEKRHHPNLLFIFYEEMKQDLRGVLNRVAAHLGKTLTEEQIVRVLDHLSFNRFAESEADNAKFIRKSGIMNEGGSFFRKGITGDWKNHFSPELNEKIDKWIAKNLAGSDLRFVMELEKQD